MGRSRLTNSCHATVGRNPARLNSPSQGEPFPPAGVGRGFDPSTFARRLRLRVLARLGRVDLLLNEVGESDLVFLRRRETGDQRAAKDIVDVTVFLALEAAKLRLCRRFDATPVPHPD